MVISSSWLEAVLSHLKGVRMLFSDWVARSSAQSDQNPCLSISLSDRGQILHTSFDGRALEWIVAAVGMSVHDLLLHAPFELTFALIALCRRNAHERKAYHYVTRKNIKSFTIDYFNHQ